MSTPLTLRKLHGPVVTVDVDVIFTLPPPPRDRNGNVCTHPDRAIVEHEEDDSYEDITAVRRYLVCEACRSIVEDRGNGYVAMVTL